MSMTTTDPSDKIYDAVFSLHDLVLIKRIEELEKKVKEQEISIAYLSERITTLFY